MEEEQEQAPQGPNRSDLDALKDGAAMLSAAGNRVAALSLLWSAVAIDPLDLTAHRRLAATLASAGDLDGAAEEFARYIEFVLPLGDVARAALELTYGVNMVGGRQPLHGAAQKIANAVLALVPGSSTSLTAISAPVAAAVEPQVVAAEPLLVTPAEPQFGVAAEPPIAVPMPVVAAPVVEAVTLAPRIDIDSLFTPPAPVIPTAPPPAPVIATTQEIELGVAARVDEWITPSREWSTAAPVAPSREWSAPAPLAADPLADRRAAEALVAAAALVEPIFIKPAVTAPAQTMPGPRLVPKVPFRFCLHPGGDKHWMQLEGGAPGLVPDAVRVVDRFENVIDERLCLPMRAGDKGHSPVTSSFDAQPLVWVVVAVPSQIVAAYEAGLTWAYRFQAKVNGDWLALDLVDSGCRLSRVRSLSAS